MLVMPLAQLERLMLLELVLGVVDTLLLVLPLLNPPLGLHPKSNQAVE